MSPLYKIRTDSVQEKLRLLQSAYATGNHDLAMSLVESLKDTIVLERQLHGSLPQPDLAADDFASVDALPRPWAEWAEGWSYCKSFALFETVGIARSQEPVHCDVSFRAAQVTDPYRELRVARARSGDHTLSQVPVQIISDVRRGDQRHCSLVLFADVPAHDSSVYLLFFGNPHAELPSYRTDLRVQGEGYALRIENHHFVAQLSKQMGQLERIQLKRQHGLELYAGGKGHGEPPTIDWAHDYVDEGNFQKLRMRNWASCPNFDAVSGPLCVRVRRWGFPHSPLHPLFTPSRMHMDQTYVFYAGLPYFLKLGRMEIVKPLRIEAMRDDEWVFSGYSFTDTLWIDSQGKVHEGPVPDAHLENLWGVGFYHHSSGDAFIALWLDHSAKNFNNLAHGGAPTLHYDGHGQLWSRYPSGPAQFQPGAFVQQKNAYVVLPFEKPGAAERVEQLRHQLANPLVVRPHSVPGSLTASASGKLARNGETKDTAAGKDAIWNALRDVKDEQLYSVDANIVDLGYIYDLRISAGTVYVLVTMPHRGRPVYRFLESLGGGRVGEGIRERLLRLNDIQDVVVDFAWEPAWSVSRLTDAGRDALGLPSA